MSARLIRCVVLALAIPASLGGQAVGLSGPVPTQVESRERIASARLPLLERNYISQPFPNHNIGSWFEGVLAIHLPVKNSYARSLDSAYQQPGITKVGHGVVPSMVVNLRMTRENSAPVRTPSYMPRLRYVFSRSTRDAQAERASPRVDQWLYEATVGHYSNGQDGCLYAQQVDTNCVFRTPVPRNDLRTNRRDGSFSSHYLEAAVTRRWISIGTTNFEDERLRARRVLHLGVKVRDYAALSPIGGGMVDELRSEYGQPRLRVFGGANWERNRNESWSGNSWIEGFVEVLPGRSPQVDPVRFSLEVGHSFDRLDGVGVFARAYSGQDDYNLGFLTNIRVIHVGVAVGGESRMSFRM